MSGFHERHGAGRWIAVVVGLAFMAPGSDRLPATESAARSSTARATVPRVEIPDTGLDEREQILHLLNRIGFGPRPGDVARVGERGIAAYIEAQLDPGSVPDPETARLLEGLETLGMSSHELLVTYPPPQLLRAIERRLSTQMGMDSDATGDLFPELEDREDRDRMKRALDSPNRIVLELSQAKVLRAVHSERQLQEVMTDFWFNHFNVYIGKGADRWWTTSYEYDAIRPHALGRFRDLLGATARHPAMLFYLDNWLSVAPSADLDNRELRAVYTRALTDRGLRPNTVVLDILRSRGVDTTQLERRFRRQQESMTRAAGRHFPEPPDDPDDAAPRRSGLNENYARELLELHTLGVDGGYTQRDIIEVARCFTGWTMMPPQDGWGFIYIDDFHDGGTKTVLGHRIENRGMRDGEAVLDMLAKHPSTARFVSYKIARRFVSDEPPETLVAAMATTFLETDGDIRSVLRTMLGSEEFWSPKVVRAKVKTPFEFVASALRATDAELAELPGRRDGEPPGPVFVLRELGQPLYAAQPPTGYPTTADAWVSTGALLGRMKVAVGLAADRIPGARIELPEDVSETGTTRELLADIGIRIIGRQPTDDAIDALAGQLDGPGGPGPGVPAPAIERVAVGWILASAEFQRR
jgi:uncharacterized protein (DUF1800 family)